MRLISLAMIDAFRSSLPLKTIINCKTWLNAKTISRMPLSVCNLKNVRDESKANAEQEKKIFYLWELGMHH